ncbi:hypothetical protein Vi05172_g12162 [Venturia inaequalis]|nr:hypothetical protein Vi05172_g12162 [Venturia inaequalis]
MGRLSTGRESLTLLLRLFICGITDMVTREDDNTRPVGVADNGIGAFEAIITCAPLVPGQLM